MRAAQLCYRRGLSLDSNHALLHVSLGQLYTHGLLEPIDAEDLFMHFSIAASQGNADAQSELAGMYRDGEGVKQDYKLAFFWREKAAKQDILATNGS